MIEPIPPFTKDEIRTLHESLILAVHCIDNEEIQFSNDMKSLIKRTEILLAEL